jgi:polynucleotide 5'-hydroxyl-kinase GRC3/NOL9
MVSHLPTRIRNLVHQDSTIIVLQELRTGIEGLGNICQTFEGVFAPSRWQKNETDQQLGVSGIHMVFHHQSILIRFINDDIS